MHGPTSLSICPFAARGNEGCDIWMLFVRIRRLLLPVIKNDSYSPKTIVSELFPYGGGGLSKFSEYQ